MKQFLTSVMLLVSLLFALPNLNGQSPLAICLDDLMGKGTLFPTTQDVKTIYTSVEAPKGKTIGPGYKAPTVKYSREAMVFSTVKFHFNSYFPLTENLVDTWVLRIDFGDGSGYQSISPSGETKTITYPPDSKQELKAKARITLNTIVPIHIDSDESEVKDLFIKKAEGIYSQPDAIWRIVTPTFPVPSYASASYPANSRYLVNSGGSALAYIKYGKDASGSTRTSLVKPIIFVDGIDFGTDTKYIDEDIVVGPNYESNIVRAGVTGWDIFTVGAEDTWLQPGESEQFRKYPEQFADLNNSGYDVIFLDFEDGATFIQKNAEVLKALIRRINMENVVVGASMGGQVARMALTQMEKANEKSCTTLHVSFDSPHKGAYIPLSLQAMAWTAWKSGLEKGTWENLNTPAAKQMLVENFADAVKNGRIRVETATNSIPVLVNSFLPNTLRAPFVAEMAGLDYPKLMPNVAITCGGDLGQPQTSTGGTPFNSNDMMMGITFNAPAIVDLMKVSMFALNGQQPNKVIFKARIPSCLEVNNTLLNLDVTFKLNQNYPSFDNANGCVRNDLLGLRRQVNQAKDGLKDKFGLVIGSILLTSDPSFRPDFCFMPTMSTLDIRNPNNPSQWDWNMNPSILTKNILDEKIIEKGLTPFDAYFAPDKNLRHVEIDDKMRTFVSNILKDMDQDELFAGLPNATKGARYNMNYRKSLIPTLNINPTGELVINDNGNSAFGIDATKDLDGKRETFDAVIGSTCGGAVVTVKNGGIFRLGSATTTNRHAVVYVADGSNLIVESGGLFSLHNNSTLIVRRGGTLTVNSGANVILNQNSSIIIEKGGTLKLEGPGGTTNFVGNGTENAIVIKGSLVTATAIQLENNAFLRFERTASISGSITEFKVTGSAKTTKMMELMDNTQLKAWNKNLDFSTGQILYRSGTMIVLTPKNGSGTSVYTKFESVTFQGADGAQNNCGLINDLKYKQITPTTSKLVPFSPDAIIVLDCDFNNLNVGIHLLHEDLTEAPESFSVDYSRFNDYSTCGIVQKYGYQLFATSTTFHSEVPYRDFNRLNFNTDGTGGGVFSTISYRDFPVAMDLKRFNFGHHVYLTSCMFTGSNDRRKAFDVEWDWNHDFDNESIIAKEVTDPDGFTLSLRNYLIMLEDVNHFTFSGTTATEACAAIFSKRSNVDLLHKSLISNSCIAIEVEGEVYDATLDAMGTQKGRVMMDCSKMLNNAIGIYGTKAWLNIDEVVQSGGVNVNAFDNTYTLFASGSGGTTRQTQGRYVDIHYPLSYTAVPVNTLQTTYYGNGTIKASSNKWVEDPRQLDNYFISEDVAKGSSAPFVQFFLDFDQNVPDPNDCDEQPFGKNGAGSRDRLPEEAYGEIEYEGKKIQLGPIYWEAISYYYQRRYEAAAAKFKEIAVIPEEVRKASKNSFVYQYIDVARTMVFAEKIKEDMPIEQLMKSSINNSMLVFPNPAEEYFKLVLPSGRYDVQLSDVLGRVIKQIQIADYEEISTENVQSGLYQITVRKKGEQAVFQTGKIVIKE